ncbi:SufB/SufD family protein [Pontivivens ytuae]|uniref:SufD family Fe-S cluster assembly protein n=1 Tax=Pontivivens ytuae TaxID=2789856 RepID=A0A7S9LR20_9RHOB|nr:SufD family Fe-S cluster assembly protein [Pontivivens ytuae]QPH53724.1 SufD family Fe-S cluster assembly protein [Pontivivens ytuae]
MVAVKAKNPVDAAGLIARHTLGKPGAKWAEAVRQSARERLMAVGAPQRRDEYWRFTNPAKLVADTARAGVMEADPVFEGIDALVLTFVDGVFDPAHSDALEGENLEIQPLTEALESDIHWAGELFGKLEERGQTPVPRELATLNTAVASEGMVIRATGNVARPVRFNYIHSDESSDAVLHNLVRVDAGAELTVLENGPAAARFNKMFEIDIAEGGALHHVRAQGRDHERQAFTAMFTRLAAEATYKSFTLTVNGVLTRNEQVVEFTGDDAVAHVAGASIGEGDFHHDDTVFVTHDGVNCESRQVFKKVLKSGATGVFQGKILVKEGAQKTDGYQISQGLLLDDDSQFLAKPELEIYADDVACSHGSTCGGLDETGLFYLLSRGVPRKDATNMLVIAFLDEAVQEIEDEALAETIRERIGGWLARRG